MDEYTPDRPVTSADTGTQRTAEASTIDTPGTVPEREPGTQRTRFGPNWMAVVIGLLCLLASALVVLRERVDWRIDWNAYGPGVLIGAGLVLVLLGGIGLARRGH